jgi:hypothetical protein
MNIGEMQRSLSQQAEHQPNHRFGDLYGFLGDLDWLWLAHDRVAQNAGSKTAGCDGITMAEFDADLERNLNGLGESLKSGTFVACPVRRVRSPSRRPHVQTAGGCQRPGESVDAVHPLSPSKDRDGPTEGKPDAVKVARPVWGEGPGNVPRTGSHAEKRSEPEVTRPAPTLPRRPGGGPGQPRAYPGGPDESKGNQSGSREDRPKRGAKARGLVGCSGAKGGNPGPVVGQVLVRRVGWWRAAPFPRRGGGGVPGVGKRYCPSPS